MREPQVWKHSAPLGQSKHESFDRIAYAQSASSRDQVLLQSIRPQVWIDNIAWMVPWKLDFTEHFSRYHYATIITQRESFVWVLHQKFAADLRQASTSWSSCHLWWEHLRRYRDLRLVWFTAVRSWGNAGSGHRFWRGRICDHARWATREIARRCYGVFWCLRTWWSKRRFRELKLNKDEGTQQQLWCSRQWNDKSSLCWFKRKVRAPFMISLGIWDFQSTALATTLQDPARSKVWQISILLRYNSSSTISHKASSSNFGQDEIDRENEKEGCFIRPLEQKDGHGIERIWRSWTKSSLESRDGLTSLLQAYNWTIS